MELMKTPQNHVSCWGSVGDLYLGHALLQWLSVGSDFGLIVTDKETRILCLNRWVETHTGIREKEVIGEFLGEVFPELRERRFEDYYQEALKGKTTVISYGLHKYIITARKKGQIDQAPMFQTGVIFPLVGRDGVLGTVTKIVDVTERVIKERELQEAVSRLEEAFAQIKTLRGLLPICANCKKIRDDKGYWTQVETYIMEHTDATFTHGICPECMKELYPELYENIMERSKGEEKGDEGLGRG